MLYNITKLMGCCKSSSKSEVSVVSSHIKKRKTTNKYPNYKLLKELENKRQTKPP